MLKNENDEVSSKKEVKNELVGAIDIVNKRGIRYKPGWIGINMNVRKNDIKKVLHIIGENLKKDKKCNIYDEYLLYKKYSSIQDCIMFLKKYIILYLCDFIGKTKKYEKVRNNVMNSSYTLDIYEKYFHDINDVMMKWKSWWKIANSFDITTPCGKVNIIDEMKRLNIPRYLIKSFCSGRLFMIYYSVNRSIYGFSMSLIESIETEQHFQYCIQVFFYYLEIYFKEKGWNANFIFNFKHNMANTKQVNNIIKYKNSRYFRSSTNKEINEIVGIKELPYLPYGWIYDDFFLKKFNIYLLSEKIVSWIEYSVLHIPKFRNHDKIVSMFSYQTLLLLRVCNDIFDILNIKSEDKLKKEINLLIDEIAYETKHILLKLYEKKNDLDIKPVLFNLINNKYYALNIIYTNTQFNIEYDNPHKINIKKIISTLHKPNNYKYN
jgi:hypothetical protein